MSAMQWLKRFFMATDMPARKQTEYVMPCPFEPDKDRILIMYDDRLTPQQRDGIRDSLQEFMDGDRCMLVLEGAPKVMFISAIDVDTSDASMAEQQRHELKEFWIKFGDHANKYPYSQANDYLG